jgi:ABC-type dipeptide/oligopeptide/nickel transport system permease subunit
MLPVVFHYLPQLMFAFLSLLLYNVSGLIQGLLVSVLSCLGKFAKQMGFLPNTPEWGSLMSGLLCKVKEGEYHILWMTCGRSST